MRLQPYGKLGGDKQNTVMRRNDKGNRNQSIVMGVRKGYKSRWYEGRSQFVTCFKCQRRGHFQSGCPMNGRAIQPRASHKEASHKKQKWQCVAVTAVPSELPRGI